MNVSFNLNYLLVFGLVICIIVLIFMLFKYIFVKDTNSSNHNITGSPNEKNLQSNIDFFNTTAKIIEKSNKIVDTKNNKVYQFIDLGDKILIMEDTYFIPQKESLENEAVILGDDAKIYDSHNFIPEQVISPIEKNLFNDEVNAMSEVIKEAETNYDETHNDVYDYAVKEAEIVSSSLEDSEQFSIEDDNKGVSEFI